LIAVERPLDDQGRPSGEGRPFSFLFLVPSGLLREGESVMSRLIVLVLVLAALVVAGCGEGRSTVNKDRDKPEPPPAGKK